MKSSQVCCWIISRGKFKNLRQEISSGPTLAHHFFFCPFNVSWCWGTIYHSHSSAFSTFSLAVHSRVDSSRPLTFVLSVTSLIPSLLFSRQKNRWTLDSAFYFSQTTLTPFISLFFLFSPFYLVGSAVLGWRIFCLTFHVYLTSWKCFFITQPSV